MLDQVKYLKWEDLYGPLMAGNPPVLYVLLAINATAFGIWFWRKKRNARKLRRETAIMLQVLVIGLSVMAIWREEANAYYDISYRIKQSYNDITSF